MRTNVRAFKAILLCLLLIIHSTGCAHRVTPPQTPLPPPVFGPLQQELQKPYLELFQLARTVRYTSAQIEQMRKYLNEAQDYCVGQFKKRAQQYDSQIQQAQTELKRGGARMDESQRHALHCSIQNLRALESQAEVLASHAIPVAYENKKAKLDLIEKWPEQFKKIQQEIADGARTVSLYVTVEEKDNLVRGLTEQNFRLFEEGQPRSFQLAPPETPASIALLVENSQNSWWLYYQDIRNALEGFVNSAPEGNWYALATFSHGLTVNVDFTKQKGKIISALGDLTRPLWDEVDTYDAIYEMLDKMDRLPGRRVLVFVGSGFDSFSSYSLDDVQKKIESANVLVYGAGVGSQLRGYYEPYLGSIARMNLLQAEAFLRMLADKSGGEAWFPLFATAFAGVMQSIMQILENQYRLVYTSQIPSDGKFHKIKVEAFQVVGDQRHNYKVRVRQGWRF